ncbi:MAG TPA: carboxypeptidase-like regulatory domain-containing protein [Chitinophagaceae bacterium]|nr:carboxypeptidase-like regulatory domain-containing protein [Chitinophagaceae bacterium]
MNRNLYILSLVLASFILFNTANGQAIVIKGTVYDSTRFNTMAYVTVNSTSGISTFTNADGNYKLEVAEKDSIWFSYLGKPTIKFPVHTIQNPQQFDISLQVNITTLKEVRIRQRNYRFDSIQNRLDYAKIFDYQKPGLKTVTPQYGAGAGFDLDELINVFRFKRNRSMLAFQQRLLQEEREKFIDHRFSKSLVRRLTKLDGAALDSFMVIYRPSYTFTKFSGDYDFQLYIKQSFERFKKGLPPEAVFKEEIEEN